MTARGTHVPFGRWVFSGIALLLAAATNAAWADIPPPPPDIPGTEIALPRPEMIAVAGLFLSAAFITAGIAVRRRGTGLRSGAFITAAVLTALLAIAGALFAVVAHNSYQDALDNWEPLGPID
jgi:hypothetical protein